MEHRLLKCGVEFTGHHPLTGRDESELDRRHPQAGTLQLGGGDQPDRGSHSQPSLGIRCLSPTTHAYSVQRMEICPSDISICLIVGEHQRPVAHLLLSLHTEQL